MSVEFGTKSFLDRLALTERLTRLLVPLLEKYFIIQKFGHESLLQKSPKIRSVILKIEYKQSPAVLMVKFSPDFIFYFEKCERREVFLVDFKASVTPLFYEAQIKRIAEHSKKFDLRREDIGEIEREAWLVYNKFYPPEKVVLIFATPYSPKLIVANWVSKIKCLWCLKETQEKIPIPWNCDECPIFRASGTFGVIQNEFAGGSKTPHTNIHIGEMPKLKDFLEQEFGISVDEKEYEEITNNVKSWPIIKPRGRVNWRQYRRVVDEMRTITPWLKYKEPNS
ncbi:MAG: hypothetical protein QXR87_03955 [Candidatus Hadarchaeales archaeon]